MLGTCVRGLEREKAMLKWREGKGRVASREERGTACQRCEIEMLVGWARVWD